MWYKNISLPYYTGSTGIVCVLKIKRIAKKIQESVLPLLDISPRPSRTYFTMGHGHSHPGGKCPHQHGHSSQGGTNGGIDPRRRAQIVRQILCFSLCGGFLVILWKYGSDIDAYLDPPKVGRASMKRLRNNEGLDRARSSVSDTQHMAERRGSTAKRRLHASSWAIELSKLD